VDSAILYAKYNDGYEYYLTFKGLAQEYGNFEDTEDIVSMACTADETLYLTAGQNIYVVEPDSVKKKYTKLLLVGARSIKTAPGGYMYYVQDIGLSRVPPGGGTDGWYMIFPNSLRDLDFSENGTLYCTDAGGTIYSVDTDAKAYQARATYDSTQITSMRIYNNAVYVSVLYEGHDPNIPKQAVWKNTMNADGSLGAAELVVDWQGYVQDDTRKIVKITFNDQGEMFIASSAGDALTIRRTDGILEPFYSTILYAPVVDMTWGNGKYLYLIANSDQQKKRLIRIDMQDMTGAPYFGRQ